MSTSPMHFPPVQLAAEVTPLYEAGVPAPGSGPFVVVVAGNKSTGKSSLCRVLVNSLLSSTCCQDVMYMDTDCGQPEFTAPVSATG